MIKKLFIIFLSLLFLSTSCSLLPVTNVKYGNSFNYNFLNVGQYTVQFTGSGCSIFGTVTGTINVNSSVKYQIQ